MHRRNSEGDGKPKSGALLDNYDFYMLTLAEKKPPKPKKVYKPKKGKMPLYSSESLPPVGKDLKLITREQKALKSLEGTSNFSKKKGSAEEPIP